MTVVNLFRGQVIKPDVETIGDDMTLTLTIEDYNRLPPLIAVGAPVGDVGLDQADGTTIWLDPRGGNTGASAAFDTFTGGGYWPDTSPTLDLTTGFLADEVPGSPIIDQMTALTDLKAFVDMQAPRVSGSLRWWIGLPVSGDGLILYWVDFSDPAQVALLPAPYEIDNDAANWTTRLMPIKLKIDWDWSRIRGSVYVRGGTPAPEGSGFATGIGNSPTGTAYIDAPGSITADDKAAIGAWHQNRTLVELMTGSATMPGSKFATTFSGWDLGQTVPVTSARHSRLSGHELDARPAVIQSIRGRLVTPSGGLAILIDGTPIIVPFEWKTLTFERRMDGAGQANIVLHLMDDTPFVISALADVWITLDDTQPADIEWDLEFGDIPKGSLTRELAKVSDPPFVPPVYRFNVTEKDPDGVKRGFAELVSAQIATGPASPVALPGVPMEWILIQWEDDAETIAGDMIALFDDTGTTDSAGRVFTTLGPAGVGITSASVANPTVITTATHGLTTGDTVIITGITGSTPAINGAYVVTVLSTTTFTIPVNVTVAGTGGSVGASAVLPAGYNWEISAVALPIV